MKMFLLDVDHLPEYRDQVRQYCEEKLSPRILQANRDECRHGVCACANVSICVGVYVYRWVSTFSFLIFAEHS